jgi:AraC-like DNA-binding protein/ligand-binding sensor protein
MLAKVRGQVEPAFAFAVSYLRMLSEKLGLGALAVWFGAQGIEQYATGSSKEFDWRNPLADLLRTSAPLGPKGLSPFCAGLRRRAEGIRRCRECDAQWIARTRKTGRTWVYQCHAGLSEVVAPIVVNGKCIGEVMGGQVVSPAELPGGFDDVWRSIGNIEGLDKDELAESFAAVRVVNAQELHRIRTSLQAAARALGALIESVADLMSREAMLGQVRSYLEREFAWIALTQPEASSEDIGARSKALGFDETPSVAIVAQADRTNRATFGKSGERAGSEGHTMFEAAQRLLSAVPNSIVSSIRPGELVVLLSPERTRNPALSTVRVRELAARLKHEIEASSATPILVGVGGVDADFVSLAKSYEEARNALAPGPAPWTSSPEPFDRGGANLMDRMDTIGREVRCAVREGNRDRFEQKMESQLRLIAGQVDCPEEVRQCLFAQAVFGALAMLRDEGESAAADRMQVAYAAAHSSMRTGVDMVEWFRANAVPHLDTLLDAPCSVPARRLNEVGTMVARSLSEKPNRESVARKLGMSGAHFGKSFRRDAGITYREYVRRIRVGQAQRLLLTPGKTVAQVASEVGYTTTAAFTRAFERECGASPSAYRNNPRDFALIPLPSSCAS